MTNQTTDEQQFEEERSEILLLADMDDGIKIIDGMRGVGKYDEFETAFVRSENLERFKRFNKDGEFLVDFLVEFFANIDNPTRYKFFIVPESEAAELAAKIQISLNNPSKEGAVVLEKYEYQTNHVQERLKSIDEATANRQRQQQEELEIPAKSRGRKM